MSTIPAAPDWSPFGYERRGFLGQGGFGTVYEARRADGTPVAIKELRADTDALRLISDEEWASNTALQGVYGVVSALHRFETVDAAGVPFCNIVFPLADGTLAAFMRQVVEESGSQVNRFVPEGEQPCGQTTPIMWLAAVQTCVGLAGIHSNGYVHRDIKLANLLIAGGHCCVGDLGLLVDEHIDHWSGDRVRNVAGAGTPLHVPPEMMRREPYGCQADMFSLGVTCATVLWGVENPQSLLPLPPLPHGGPSEGAPEADDGAGGAAWLYARIKSLGPAFDAERRLLIILTEPDQDARMLAADLLTLPWLWKQAASALAGAGTDIAGQLLETAATCARLFDGCSDMPALVRGILFPAPSPGLCASSGEGGGGHRADLPPPGLPQRPVGSQQLPLLDAATPAALSLDGFVLDGGLADEASPGAATVDRSLLRAFDDQELAAPGLGCPNVISAGLDTHESSPLRVDAPPQADAAVGPSAAATTTAAAPAAALVPLLDLSGLAALLASLEPLTHALEAPRAVVEPPPATPTEMTGTCTEAPLTLCSLPGLLAKLRLPLPLAEAAAAPHTDQPLDALRMAALQVLACGPATVTASAPANAVALRVKAKQGAAARALEAAARAYLEALSESEAVTPALEVSGGSETARTFSAVSFAGSDPAVATARLTLAGGSATSESEAPPPPPPLGSSDGVGEGSPSAQAAASSMDASACFSELLPPGMVAPEPGLGRLALLRPRARRAAGAWLPPQGRLDLLQGRESTASGAGGGSCGPSFPSASHGPSGANGSASGSLSAEADEEALTGAGRATSSKPQSPLPLRLEPLAASMPGPGPSSAASGSAAHSLAALTVPVKTGQPRTGNGILPTASASLANASMVAVTRTARTGSTKRNRIACAVAEAGRAVRAAFLGLRGKKHSQ